MKMTPLCLQVYVLVNMLQWRSHSNGTEVRKINGSKILKLLDIVLSFQHRYENTCTYIKGKL